MSEESGLINVYRCPSCGWHAVTWNRDDGTTPMFIRCEARCPASVDDLPGAVSSVYRVDQALIPTHEWYRPTSVGELKKMADPSVAEHVRLGGLLLRPIGTGGGMGVHRPMLRRAEKPDSMA